MNSYIKNTLGENFIVPSDFDEVFYSKQYPETYDYYVFPDSLLLDKDRLYHHYIHNKDSSSPQYYYKNINEWSKYFLSLSKDPPNYFDASLYSSIYPETKDYFADYGSSLTLSHRMYHHYLHYGKEAGYSINHKTVPIFFHIPRCGGTSVHYGIILPNIARQYLTYSTDHIYNINFIDSLKQENVFSLIGHLNHQQQNFNELFSLVQYKQYRQYNINDNIHTVNIEYNNKNISFIKNYFNTLAMIINPYGFSRFNYYIQNIIHNKEYELYILLRKPESWYKSIFYYLRDVGSWENTSKNFDKNMSFNDYITSNLFTQNWLIKNLVEIPTGTEISHTHYETCKETLEKFNYVGFVEKFDDIITTWDAKYNWQNISNTKHNVNTRSKHEKLEHSDIDILKHCAFYENKLYDYFYNKNITT